MNFSPHAFLNSNLKGIDMKRILKMNTHQCNRVLFLCMTVLGFTGCGTVPKNLGTFEPDSIVVVDGRGRLMQPVGNAGQNRYTSLWAMKSTVPLDREEKYVQAVAENIKRQLEDGRDVVVYIHGGLNLQRTSMERAAALRDWPTGPRSSSEPYILPINWQSSLYSSYRDNLFFIREGKDYRDRGGGSVLWGVLTSPIVLFRDTVGMVGSAPYVWERNMANYLVGAFPSTYEDRISDRTLQDFYFEWHQGQGHLPESALPDQKTGDLGSLLSTVFTPIRMVSSPFVRSFGEPAWDIMRRRTTLMFHRPPFDLHAGPEWTEGVMSKLGAQFVEVTHHMQTETYKSLLEDKTEDSDPKLILVCHSMGAIIGSKLLRLYPEMKFDDIVFMGAACTVRDVGEYVLPYLAKHRETEFFNLTLHPKNEVRENNWLFIAPRGSLLVYIDNMLVHPDNLLDRTAGRYENFAMSLPYLQEEAERLASRYADLTADDLRKRVYLRTFPYGRNFETYVPRKHGHFSQFNFWQRSFYDPTATYIGFNLKENPTPAIMRITP
ncbi:MAG: hypothetical protein JJU29_11240 [Verrucomicrobia bacterium]|nr:hypothetical protein [Verrucomicrobiota bacterium]MCH8512832.1 hypothetical protein [Kiritimatiellia bacterium]